MNKSIRYFWPCLHSPHRLLPFARLKQMTALAPKRLRVEISSSLSGDRQPRKLIEAARLIDDIFLVQLWRQPALHEKLKRDTTPLGRARLHYSGSIKAMVQFDGHTLSADVPPRKPWAPTSIPRILHASSSKNGPLRCAVAKNRGSGLLHRRPRDAAGHLSLVLTARSIAPRSPMARLLRDAAILTPIVLEALPHYTLRSFLTTIITRATIAWMDLDAPLISLWPVQTYNDELFGYKAAFEAYVNLRDEKETGKLKFSRILCRK